MVVPRDKGNQEGKKMNTMIYEVDGPTARITLNRPERGNGITRHTREGYAFQQRGAEVGFKEAVRGWDT